MAKNRRIIRKTQPARVRRVDDQIWPLVVAMVVLGGFLAGSVLAYLRLDDARWYANAWTWLIAIPLVIAGALISLAWTGNRLLRRTMQLAFVLGITLHVILFIAAIEVDVFHRVWIEEFASTENRSQRPTLPTPDYVAWQHDPRQRAVRDTELPVEISPPEPVVEPPPQEQMPPPPSLTEPLPRVVPDPEETVRPNVVKPQSDPLVPRQRDEMSKLSRKEATVPSRPTQRVELPDTVLHEQGREDSPRPEEIGLHPQPGFHEPVHEPPRQTPPVPEPKPTIPSELATDAATPRREAQQPAPARDHLAQTPRSVPNRQPRVTTRPDLTSVVDRVPELAPAPSVTPSNEPSAITLDDPTRKDRTAGNAAPVATKVPVTATPTPETAVAAASAAASESPSRARHAPTIAKPNVDAISAALPGRRPADATAIGSTPQRVSPVASEATAVEPSRATAGPAASVNTGVQKQAAGSDTAELRRLSAEIHGAATVEQIAARQPRQAPAPAAPALTAGATANIPPRRAVREATAAVSPLAAESPARPASNADQPDVSTSPAPLVLDKSEAGTAGRGVSQNLGQAAPGSASPATVASGSAQRASATQNLAPGPALAPQAAPLARSGIAGQSRPSTVLQATPLSPSLVSGSSQAADVNASASAALAQAASNAERGSVTASKGMLSVDTGPTTLVAESGSGRASGGGQPQMSFGAARETTPRTPRGQPPFPAILAGAVSPTPAAPAAVGGGQPSAADLAADSNALVTARAGPAAGALGGPQALGSGPATSPSLSSIPASRRAHDAADERVSSDSSAGVVHVARKGPRDSQLPFEAGAADLSVGNASDHNDDAVPAQSISAPAATSTSLKQSAAGATTDVARQVAVPVGQSSADGANLGDFAARAEAADVAPGAPRAGGGTGSPPRASRGPAIAAIAVAETVAATDAPRPSHPPSSGEPGIQTPGRLTVDRGSDMELSSGDAEVGPISRLAGPAMPVDIDSPADVGGLGGHVTVDVGLKNRLATEASTSIHTEPTRFARNRLGGPPEVSTVAAMPTESYRRRVERAKGQGDSAEGAGPQTEDAIELGLVFLGKAQLPDGRWSLDRFAKQDGLPQLASDSAATGLALLAFQGAGYHHLDFRYAQVVRQGIDFLVKNQQANGSLFVAMDDESNRVVQLYSHGIAALALSEAYGMTQDSTLREPAQRAINYIVETQNSQRGGWRYSPGVSSDTSVTGWMMMALRSGELAGLEVPKQTFRLLDRWLDSAQESPLQPHLYCYNPFATEVAEQRGGRQSTKTMTSVGLLMRLYLGWRRNNPAMARGAQYLALHPPAIGTDTNPQRDTYYWYYATQVMFHMGGRYWRDWNQRLHPVLVGAQIKEGPLVGSWDPLNPVPDRWAPFAGRLYVTTMNLLSLEVTYRHLPLYEDTAK